MNIKNNIRLVWNSLCALGAAPKNSIKPKSCAYRTKFDRFIWSTAFVTTFFLLAYQYLDNSEASSDDFGIYLLLILALFFGILGAFFAPRISEFLYSNSLPGRRRKLIERSNAKRSANRKLDSVQRKQGSGHRHHSKKYSQSSSIIQNGNNAPSIHQDGLNKSKRSD